MGIYKYINRLWKQPHKMGDLNKKRLILWRKQPATLRIERPTRLDKARAVGYRAKQGIIVVRQRVDAGSHRKQKAAGGKRSKRFGKHMTLSKNYRQIAEERANKKFRNCEVLNSYQVGADSKHYWFEIILVDRINPQVLADKNLQWMINNRGRASRGKTSAGRKSRGLRHKGKGAEKTR